MSKDNRITIRFTPDQLAAIDRWRAPQYLERSEFIRKSVLEAIGRSESLHDMHIEKLRDDNKTLSEQVRYLLSQIDSLRKN